MAIDIIALISPKAGKADRVEELLNQAALAVKSNEPGTLKYHLQRETKGEAPVLIMLETYKDKAALGTHAKTEYFQTLTQTLKNEDLLVEPMKVYLTKEAGGYASKL